MVNIDIKLQIFIKQLEYAKKIPEHAKPLVSTDGLTTQNASPIETQCM